MDPKQLRTEHTSIQGRPGPLDLQHPFNYLNPTSDDSEALSLYEVPQKSGGRRTARRVLNMQRGIAQLGMRRTTMLEIAPSKPATMSSYAEWTQSPEAPRVVKKEPDSQEGTKGRGGRRSGGRVLKGEKDGGWSGRRPRPVTSRGHQGDSISRFGSPQEISSFPRRIRYYAQILSDTRSYFHSGFRSPGVA